MCLTIPLYGQHLIGCPSNVTHWGYLSHLVTVVLVGPLTGRTSGLLVSLVWPIDSGFVLVVEWCHTDKGTRNIMRKCKGCDARWDQDHRHYCEVQKAWQRKYGNDGS